MMGTIQHWAWIVFTFLTWFYVGGVVFLLGPAFSLSEMKCALSNEKDPKERKRLKFSIYILYSWVAIYPISFIALILYHAGVITW